MNCAHQSELISNHLIRDDDDDDGDQDAKGKGKAKVEEESEEEEEESEEEEEDEEDEDDDEDDDDDDSDEEKGGADEDDEDEDDKVCELLFWDINCSIDQAIDNRRRKEFALYFMSCKEIHSFIVIFPLLTCISIVILIS